MPEQERATPLPPGVCPVCRVRTADGASLYVPSGTRINSKNGRLQGPTVPLPHEPPVQDTTPDSRDPESPTQSIYFWQGLVAGLAITIVVLFLVAA